MALNRRKTRMYEPWGYRDQDYYESDEDIIIDNLDKLFADAKYDDSDKKIHFYNTDGEEKASIDVTEFANSVIDHVEYDSTTKILTIVFSNGDVIEINMADLIDESDFGDGLEVTSGIVSVKIDSLSDPYLTVSSSGVSLSGVSGAIYDLQYQIDHLEISGSSAYTELKEQLDELSGKTSELSGKVEDETVRAISAETELSGMIDDVSDELDRLEHIIGQKDNLTLEVSNGNEAAFGSYNVTTPSGSTAGYISGGTLFSIGNGTDAANRNNAMEVKENGEMYLWVEGEFMSVNKLISMLAHEIYDEYDTPFNNHEYIDLDLPSHKLWAKYNVGASSETEYGKYFQYGFGEHDYTETQGTSSYSGTEDPLSLTADTAWNVMGGKWVTPTKADYEELLAYTNHALATIDGVNGVKFTSTATTTTAYLFIPFGGYIEGTSGTHDVGSQCYMLTSTPYDANNSYVMDYYNTPTRFTSRQRIQGFNVRGIIDVN